MEFPRRSPFSRKLVGGDGYGSLVLPHLLLFLPSKISTVMPTRDLGPLIKKAGSREETKKKKRDAGGCGVDCWRSWCYRSRVLVDPPLFRTNLEVHDNITSQLSTSNLPYNRFVVVIMQKSCFRSGFARRLSSSQPATRMSRSMPSPKDDRCQALFLAT